MQEKSSTMSLIGLGFTGFTRRLSLPDVELPFTTTNTRRRGNASISLSSSSSSHYIPSSLSSTSSSSSSSSSNSSTTPSYWPTRASLTPLLGGRPQPSYNHNDDYENEKYDEYYFKNAYHRRRSSINPSSSSTLMSHGIISKQWMITLIYLFLFGIVLITYIAQNGFSLSTSTSSAASSSSLSSANDTLAKIQYKLGMRTSFEQANGHEGNKGGAEKVEKEMVWSDEVRVNTTLPKPFDGYRWTFLHANVLPSNETGQDKLEMLTFIESIPPKRQVGWWQLTLPHIPDVLSDATCGFSTPQGVVRVPAVMEWDFKRAPFQTKRARWALLISCDMPKDYLSSSTSSPSVSLDLLLADKSTTFTQAISLKSTSINAVVPKGSLGICIAPLYGPINDSKTLQWRIHHAKLGVQTVHWYDRDGRGKTKEWVKELNRLFGLKDTYNEAPCISKETCGKEGLLEDKGVSGDQVLYYADCLARSRHTYPTEWLAMIDIDEYLFPTSNASSISSFLSEQDATTAALAFERYIAPADPVLSNAQDSTANSPSLLLDTIQTVATPLEVDRHDNTKMIYRTSALKLAWVHWEVSFRSDQPAQIKKKFENMDKDGIIVVHVSNFKGRGPFKTSFDVRRKLEDHVESVREGYRAMIGKLPWLGV